MKKNKKPGARAPKTRKGGVREASTMSAAGPSTVSSSSALEVRVAQLRKQQQADEARMVHAATSVIGNRPDGTALREVARALADVKARLSNDDVHSVASSFSSGIGDALDAAEGYVNAAETMTERRREHELLVAVQRVYAELDALRAGAGELRRLQSAEEALRALPAVSTTAEEMNREISRIRENIMRSAIDALTDSISITSADDGDGPVCRIRVARRDVMERAWERAAEVDVLEDAATAVGRSLVDALYASDHFLNHPGAVASTRADTAATTLEVLRRGGGVASTEGLPSSSSAPGIAVDFIVSAVCATNAAVTSAVGRVVWPHILTSFESEIDRAVQPGPGMASSISHLVRAAADVEKTGATLCCSTGTRDGITKRVNEIILDKGRQRRKQLTCIARTALAATTASAAGAADAFDGAVRVDEVGRMVGGSNHDDDSYWVSSGNVEYADVIRMAYEEGQCAAASGSSILAQELLQAAADTIELSLALYSSRDEGIRELPQLAILYANDFKRTARVASALALEHAPDFLECGLGTLEATSVRVLACSARCTQISVGLVDAVAGTFREQIDEILSDMIDLRSPKTDVIIRAFDQAIYAMHRLINVVLVGGMLSRREAIARVKDVTDGFCSAVFEKIMRLGSVDAEECESVHAILSYVTMNLKESILKKRDSSDVWVEAYTILSGFESWTRLCAITDALDTPLRDITEQWEAGAWQSRGMAADEIVKIITIVFQFTSLRDQCIGRIRAHAA